MNLEDVLNTFDLADFREIPVDNFAFIGDAVIGLKYKLLMLGDGRRKTYDVSKKSINFISAKAHSNFSDNVLKILSEDEENIFKRAFNSKGAKKRGNDIEYRNSTGLEAVIGYLFLKKDYEKLSQVFEVINKCMFTEEMSLKK